MLAPRKHEPEQILQRAPLAAVIAAVCFVAWTAILPPRNWAFVLSGMFLGCVAFGGLIVGYRFRPRWAWLLALVAFMAFEIPMITLLPAEDVSHSAGYLHHQFMAATTLLTLVSFARHRIVALINRHRAV